MPQSINGIGTIYYGRSNVRERPGICESCRKPSTLTSYDTRYWFIVIFIPIIPLGKKRIIDQCARCRRHRVADLREWEEARKKALEEGMRKVVEQPHDLKALTELHGACLLYGEWEKADQLEGRIGAEFADDPKAHLHLASANAYRGRVDQAQVSLARARELDPTLAEAATPPPRSSAGAGSGGRRQKILLAFLGLLVVGGFFFADRHKVSHRTLHVVNGYAAPVTVQIPGAGEVQVGPLSRRELELPEGRYTAHVTGAVIADLPVELSSYLFVRVFDERVFVLNPGGVALLLRQEAVYQVEGRSSSDSGRGTYSVHYGRPFESFDNIDFPFQEFPSEIRMKSSDSKRKSRLEHYTNSAMDVYNQLMEDRRVTEALSLAEWAIDSHPSHDEFLSAYAEAGADPVRRERVLQGLRRRTGRRPVDLPLHRAYQNLERAHGSPGLVAEYDELLKADPRNSALLYLRGRLISGIRESSGWFDRAVEADPKNAYAHFALAYGKASQGRWKEALESSERATRLEPENGQFRDQQFEIRMGLGQLELLEGELREQSRKDRYASPMVSFRLVGVTALLGRRDAAMEVCEEYRRNHAGPQAKAGANLAGILRCVALYLAGDFDGLEAEAAKGEKDSLKVYRVSSLIERGRVDEAEALEGPDGDSDAYHLLARSIAWTLKGDPAKAAERRNKAAELFKSSQAPAVAVLLTAGKAPSLEEALDVELPPQQKTILLTAIAQAFPDSAAEIRPRAEALNISLAFPRRLVQRALAATAKKP
jgi:tetratricopeptide (TPR) repeat protein